MVCAVTRQRARRGGVVVEPTAPRPAHETCRRYRRTGPIRCRVVGGGSPARNGGMFASMRRALGLLRLTVRGVAAYQRVGS